MAASINHCDKFRPCLDAINRIYYDEIASARQGVVRIQCRRGYRQYMSNGWGFTLPPDDWFRHEYNWVLDDNNQILLLTLIDDELVQY